MAGQWSVLQARVIAGAIARQSRAMEVLTEAYGSEEKQREAYAWHDFMRKADECGHLWGEAQCSCELCADVGKWVAQAVQQVQQQVQQQQLAGQVQQQELFQRAKKLAKQQLGP